MRSASRLARGSTAGLIAGLLLVAIPGCGGSGDGPADRSTGRTTTPPQSASGSTAVGPFRVLRGSARSAGTSLVEGLTVPAGSDLLGSVFPDVDGRGGFLALGLVVGDPVTVFNDYLGQAQQLGMGVSDGGGCVPSGTAIACVRTVEDPGDGEALTVRVERRPAGRGFVSHVGLRYRPPGSIPLATIGSPQPAALTDPLPAVTMPATVAPPPESALNASVAPFGPLMAVQPGTELVAPPGPCGCSPKGWSAVVRVGGDPTAAIKAYAATVTRVAVNPTARTIGARRVLSADLGLVAGGFIQLRTVTQGATTYLLIAVATP